MCLELIVDMTVPGALGDAIQVFHNDNPVTENDLPNGVIMNALNAQQTSNSFCIWQAYDGDRIRFVNGGSDGVSFTQTETFTVVNSTIRVLGLHQRYIDQWCT